jgi:glycosyltransferase involved in cell wall biosynthesis
MLRVSALLPHPFDTSPSQRYRLEQWQQPLRAHGIEMELHHLVRDHGVARGLQRRPPDPSALLSLVGATARRATSLLTGPAPDAWVVHREATMIGPALLERLMARRAPLIFDFDDAIWLTSGQHGRRTLADQIRRPWKTNYILRASAGVSAGNAYLAAHAAQFAPDVEIVPTTIDVTGTYARQKTPRTEGLLTIGWSGSHSTAKYIRDLLPVLAELRGKLPFRLLVIGASDVAHPGLEIECRPWRSATEVDDLLEIDVGLMPLVSDAWSSGKCGLKALQYMALAIPPVISPVGVNTEIVSDGENGILASTNEDWHRALQALAEPSLRARLGASARRTVESRYSAELGAEKFAALIRRVSQAGQR